MGSSFRELRRDHSKARINSGSLLFCRTGNNDRAKRVTRRPHGLATHQGCSQDPRSQGSHSHAPSTPKKGEHNAPRATTGDGPHSGHDTDPLCAATVVWRLPQNGRSRSDRARGKGPMGNETHQQTSHRLELSYCYRRNKTDRFYLCCRDSPCQKYDSRSMMA